MPRSSLRSSSPLRGASRAFFALLPVAGAAVAIGCSSAPSTSAVGVSTAPITGPHGEECDRSPYNCKVPNFETTPPGITHDTNRAFDDFDESYYWGVTGQPALLDGEGGLRGYVASDGGHTGSVLLDFGERKVVGGVTQVYAFSVLLTNGVSASGWIPQSTILRQNTLAEMPTISPSDPGTPYYETDWVVTGGDLESDHVTLALNAEYGDRRVNPDVTDGQHASDYLVRNWDPSTGTGYVNFLYNLPGSGGVTTDTLPMCVHFKRYTGVDDLVTDLYFTGSPDKSALTLEFAFGTIDGRRGWITHEMLTASTDLGALDPNHPCSPSHAAPPPPPPPPAAVSCGVVCCESGSGVGAYSATSATACIDQAQTFCDAYGHVQSVTAGGAGVYTASGSESDLRCWAKCNGRTDYHEVTGVTSDCDGAASSYCAESDRGGLGDATWSRCDPN